MSNTLYMRFQGLPSIHPFVGNIALADALELNTSMALHKIAVTPVR